MTNGKRLLAYRRGRGRENRIPQKMLAASMHIQQSTICHWEGDVIDCSDADLRWAMETCDSIRESAKVALSA